MNQTESVHSTYFSKNQNNAKLLKTGDSVLVRVISDKQNGKYEGSVAGVKITLNSKNPLKVGSTFVANVNIKNGKLEIIPKQDFISIEQNQGELEILQNEKIFELLENLGLPQDSISLELLKQMKQLDMSFNLDVLKKFHQISLKFKGKEKSASQMLLLLLKKGINANDEELLQLLYELEGDFENFEKEQKSQNEKFSIIKKINQKNGDWKFFPFEIVKLNQNEVFGSGCIKIFFENEILKILNLNCKYQNKEYLFNVEYENKNVKTVRFFVSPNDDEKKSLEKLKSLFCKINPNIKVLWSEKSKIEGTSASLEEIYKFEGNV